MHNYGNFTKTYFSVNYADHTVTVAGETYEVDEGMSQDDILVLITSLLNDMVNTVAEESRNTLYNYKAQILDAVRSV
jgi:hypothetical protein